MKRTMTAIAAAFALAGCINDSYTADDGAFVVRHGDGGLIEEFEQRLAYLNMTETPVRIEGFCASACTMYLGADDVCISRDANFAFHGPSDPAFLTLAPYVRADRDEWLDRLTAPYPPRLRAWFYESAADKFFGPAFRHLSAAEVQTLTDVPYCEGGDDGD